MDELSLTNSEWHVLSCLWEQTPMTVMELVSAMKRSPGWAKSTTITTLRRMEDKGLLRCQMKGRTRHYYPAVEQKQALRQETRSFLDKVYGGSVGLMVSAMAQDQKLSKEEIDQLYTILKQAEEDAT